MHIQSGLAPVGIVRAVFRSTITGEVTEIIQGNMFVTAGRNKVRDYLAGDAPSYPTHCAVGDDGNAVTGADVDIGTEEARVTIAQRIKDVMSLQINSFFNTTEAAGEYLQKAGLFDSAGPGGTLFAAALFTRREKDPTETLTIEWSIDLSN